MDNKVPHEKRIDYKSEEDVVRGGLLIVLLFIHVKNVYIVICSKIY